LRSVCVASREVNVDWLVACEVVTARRLDRERTSFYLLQVRCHDAGDEPRVTETSIRVNVVDINDNSPVFTAQTYRGTLVENNYIGASVLQASHMCDCDRETNLTRFTTTARENRAALTTLLTSEERHAAVDLMVWCKRSRENDHR